MPFGLRNAGNTFQPLMDQVLGDPPFCFVYMDNILIFSKNLSSHVDHLREVFLLCRQHGLTLASPSVNLLCSRSSFPDTCSLLTVVRL